MKHIVFTAATTALLLAGCTSFKSFTAFEPATPADYTGPTANVADRVVAISPQRLHVFEITQVDGRRRAGKASPNSCCRCNEAGVSGESS